ncbi:DoxX family protein [Streptomyces sp. NPDC017941]|uniref:DoxX family protein n=1 Tax=Streptomyces sp. NPDC017941 TaxID=3365018 RepID=UPI0037955499
MKVRVGKWLRTLASSPVTRAAGGPANRAIRRRRGLAAGVPPTLLPTGVPPAAPRWSGATRTAFRFGFVYAGVYCLTTPQIYLALRGGGMGRLQEAADTWAKRWTVRLARAWMATRVLNREIGDNRFDGGDDPYTWAGQLCWLAGAAAVTPVWSVLDRNRTDYATLDKWFRLAVRFCLAGQMFSYGAAKAVPLQFQLPPSKLVQPLGDLSPMSLLWAQTGFSKPYQILLGCAEITGGLLLIVPRTAALGALLSAVEMTQVVILNMTFDVPVKAHSLNLLLLSLLLLAPETARLAGALVTDRALPPAARRDLFRSRAANRAAAALQIGAGLWLLRAQLRNDWEFWKTYGGGQEKPELYGIWEVEDFAADGEQHPPLTTDGRRWRRLVVDSANAVTIQRMDDSLDACMAVIDMAAGSIALTRMADPTWQATLTFRRPAADRLTVEAKADGSDLRLHLRRRALDTVPLVSRGFHWVQDTSYLR